MNAIQGLQTTSLQQLLLQQSASVGTANTTGGASRSQSQPESLNSILESSGLSANDQSSLKSDLTSAIDNVFTSSSSFPPDPKDVQSAVESVFSKYGLDAGQLSSKLAPPEGGGPPGGGAFPGGMGGPPPCGGASSTDSSSDASSGNSDATSTLLDALKKFLSQASGDNSSQNTSDYVFTALIGFSAQA
ncbi:MAG: hypothetical protein U0872_04955 [Planctomycetaceae bacterium]